MRRVIALNERRAWQAALICRNEVSKMICLSFRRAFGEKGHDVSSGGN